MPVTVVVGGQFGSEGKGKVAHFLAKNEDVRAVVRCGGVNSGHTIRDCGGRKYVFQQLPTAAIIPEMISVLVPGSYIDLEILRKELKIAKACGSTLIIDPKAVVMTDEQLMREAHSLRCQLIGSTGAGMAEAISDRVSRTQNVTFADSIDELKPYLADTSLELRTMLDSGERVLLEGTQGFSLSLIHSDFYPYVTSRDTTAAAFVSEAGMSPLDVDDIVLVIRTYPIRVSGKSGPLEEEITWDIVTKRAQSREAICEYTTVTKRKRRVSEFDARLVKKAIAANQPTQIVLNHLDYINAKDRGEFVERVQYEINHTVNWFGLDEKTIYSDYSIANVHFA